MTAPPDQRTRLILYVGKGGVGKTTLAAATATRCALDGRKTLVVSTDVAHSLGDTFDSPLNAEPREIAPSLFAQEISVLEEARRSWGTVQRHMAQFLEHEGIPAVQADELAVVPGMQEIAALVEISRVVRENVYDCVVVDAAPTGETIRLLTMPDSFTWYAGKIGAWRGRINKVAQRLIRSAVPNLAILDVVDDLKDRLAVLRDILTDPRHSSYRIVVTPERTVLKEAQRAETYLNLFEYPVDAVILNRVIPITTSPDEFLRKLIDRQNDVISAVRTSFAALPIFEAPMSEQEPIGVSALEALSKQVFAAVDPYAVLHVGPTLSFVPTPEGYELRIPMPNVEIGKIALNKRGDELYVDLGSFRREIPLPAALAACDPVAARLRDGVLQIEFKRRTEVATPVGVSTVG